MTKKDYVAIARAVSMARDKIMDCENVSSRHDLLDGTSYAVDYIADVMQSDNPRFDRARFLAACGVQS